MGERIAHRVHCACITKGCVSFLVWEDGIPSDEPDARLLRLNGWRLDHGRWICGHHDAPEPG